MQVLERSFISALTMRTPESSDDRILTELGGRETTTPDGTCWTIETSEPIPEFRIAEETVRRLLQKDLTLVRGIGPEREKLLRKKGIRTLNDLKRTKWGQDAEETADILQNGTAAEIIRYYQTIGRGAEPLLTGFAAACRKEKLLFYDIETLGMTHSPIILFGCGVCCGTELKITQYLLRNIGEEITALEIVAGLFKDHPVPVTYNGKAFDLPYTSNRLGYYGERELRPEYHIDLLHPARRMFKGGLPDCCLGTVEEYILDIPRNDDLPGYLVPLYYQKYLSTRDPAYLSPIVTHNRQDVASLARLLAKQTELLYAA